jgi:hypothetical protein
MALDVLLRGRQMWYRVMEFPGDEGHSLLGIHEVYYDDNGDLKSYTKEPVPVVWEGSLDVDDMNGGNDIINMMLEALNKPILKPSDFPNGNS